MTTENTDTDEGQAYALFAQGLFAEAEPLFRRILAAKPHDAAALYNLGVTLAKLERYEEAIACYRAAITLNNGFADAYTNFGYCLNELNMVPQARQSFAIARMIEPNDPIAQLNEGIAALTLGDYAAGWQGFSARWQLPAYAALKRDFNKPVWHGEALTGKTIFIYAEQGFGDTLQMARYIPILISRNATVIVEVPPALVALIQNIDGAPIVITKGDQPPPFNFYCGMMDIPGAIGTAVDTIPHDIPYLSADNHLVTHYENAVPHRQPNRRRIGLAWAGRASHENDRNRSLSFAQIAPLLDVPGIDWVSLQRIVPENDIAALNNSAVTDWGRHFQDFSATAAAIMTLDLVITVDTAIAHLAGALGKPVWILLPFHADWRWFMTREDSPWYPTARLFRQKKRRDWDETVARVAASLAA